MLQKILADLHIHTCLSPCGDLEMSPEMIVQTALERGLRLIAICDHNSAENSEAVMRAANGKELTVLPGIEVTTKEEVHILALFDSIAEALKLQDLIYANLEGENDAATFGMQVVVNAAGFVLGFNPKLLIGATTLSVEEIVNAVHLIGGLAIAAHIDREGFGIIGQLGFIPAQLKLDALEISPRIGWQEAQQKFKEYQHFPFVQSSDAHQISDIGAGSTPFLLERVTFQEIKLALNNREGRKLSWCD